MGGVHLDKKEKSRMVMDDIVGKRLVNNDFKKCEWMFLIYVCVVYSL